MHITLSKVQALGTYIGILNRKQQASIKMISPPLNIVLARIVLLLSDVFLTFFTTVPYFLFLYGDG